MYWFGKQIESHVEWMQDKSWQELRATRLSFSKIKLDQILDILDAFSLEASGWISEAKTELIKESGFSEEEVIKTLQILPELLKKKNLEKRVKAEFTNSLVIDQFVKLPHFSGKVKASPKGILLHVTAGNVFLSSIDSLIMGFLTKNISIVKVSSQNTFFPLFFAQKLQEFDKQKILSDKFAILHWKGGEEKIETFIKSKVNTIIAWGGEEMISAYKKNLPQGVKLLDFGPKISLQLISRSGLQHKDLSKVAAHIVQDIIPWDQAACASPQNLYLETGVDEAALLDEINKAFLKAPKRGNISEDEAVEILKEKYRGLYSELMESGRVLSGAEHLIHLENNQSPKPSPLNRSLIVKRFDSISQLYELLTPFGFYLQSCSYLLDEREKQSYLETLALTGIKRFAPLGTITWGMEGAPHDGRFVLRELVDFIGDEMRVVDYGEVSETLEDASTLKDYFNHSERPRGYIFSSGGTTGEPKFVHFSYEEFDFMTDMLADNFKAQGIKPGMTVANLFVAGNLWSSFMAVEKALEKIGAIQLPIGGLCTSENILLYLNKFRPQVVLGIPSLLVMTAEFGNSKGYDLEVEKVFYAGEALSEMRMEYLRKVWKVKQFGSAGYASVDAGVIGYQCDKSGPGEHHLFSDLIEMRIVNDEAIVTSIGRNTLPVKNYRTGDKVVWVSDCTCGRKDKRFKLLGRIDNTLQIWSCRLQVGDIEKSLKDLDSSILTFQLILSAKNEEMNVREKLDLYYEIEKNDLDPETLALTIYENSRDLKDTISFEEFRKSIRFIGLPHGQIPRNPRTGKISLVQDLRH